MTWRMLLQKLQEMTEDRLDDSVTIYDATEDEAFGDIQFDYVTPGSNLEGILDNGHSYLVFYQ